MRPDTLTGPEGRHNPGLNGRILGQRILTGPRDRHNIGGVVRPCPRVGTILVYMEGLCRG